MCFIKKKKKTHPQERKIQISKTENYKAGGPFILKLPDTTHVY